MLNYETYYSFVIILQLVIISCCCYGDLRIQQPPPPPPASAVTILLLLCPCLYSARSDVVGCVEVALSHASCSIEVALCHVDGSVEVALWSLCQLFCLTALGLSRQLSWQPLWPVSSRILRNQPTWSHPLRALPLSSSRWRVRQQRFIVTGICLPLILIWSGSFCSAIITMHQSMVASKQNHFQQP